MHFVHCYTLCTSYIVNVLEWGQLTINILDFYEFTIYHNHNCKSSRLFLNIFLASITYKFSIYISHIFLLCIIEEYSIRFWFFLYQVLSIFFGSLFKLLILPFLKNEIVFIIKFRFNKKRFDYTIQNLKNLKFVNI